MALTVEQVRELDAARGDVSRADWIRARIFEALPEDDPEWSARENAALEACE